jgi:hypothetical protein
MFRKINQSCIIHGGFYGERTYLRYILLFSKKRLQVWQFVVLLSPKYTIGVLIAQNTFNFPDSS